MNVLRFAWVWFVVVQILLVLDLSQGQEEFIESKTCADNIDMSNVQRVVLSPGTITRHIFILSCAIYIDYDGITISQSGGCAERLRRNSE